MTNVDILNHRLDQLLYKIEANVLPIPRAWNFDHFPLSGQKQERTNTFMDSLRASKERDLPEATKQKARLRAMREQLIDVFANLDYASVPTDSRIAKQNRIKSDRL